MSKAVRPIMPAAVPPLGRAEQAKLGHANLPRPLPDEMLYSIFARAAVHSGHTSPKGLLAAVYRYRGVVAVPDLPTNLFLLQQLFDELWNASSEEIVTRHTLWPYYLHFTTAERRIAAFRDMQFRSNYLHQRLGICSGGIRRIGYFRLCAACSREDFAAYGETYWRRVHHLPGVFLCVWHKQPLLETTVPFRPFGIHEHVNATRQRLAAAVALLRDESVFGAGVEIAQRSATLLSPSGPASFDYRDALRERGLTDRWGSVARFREAFAAVVPAELARRVFIAVDRSGIPSWLDRARRKPRTMMHPLKHICIQMILATELPSIENAMAKPNLDRRGVSRIPGLREQAASLAHRGLSNRAIALEMAIAWKTAARMLRPLPVKPAAIPPDHSADRSAWTSLIRADPNAIRTDLRRQQPALYARLYRVDRSWLVTTPCAEATRVPVSRVDWPKRDEELAADVILLAAKILSREPAVRVSRSRVLRELQRQSVVTWHSGKLPETMAALARHCETLEGFRVRRIRVVLRSSDLAGTASRTRLLRAAHINTTGLKDGGMDLIREAMRSLRHGP